MHIGKRTFLTPRPPSLSRLCGCWMTCWLIGWVGLEKACGHGLGKSHRCGDFDFYRNPPQQIVPDQLGINLPEKGKTKTGANLWHSGIRCYGYLRRPASTESGNKL